MAAPDAVDVHPSNAQQLRAWDGDEGAYWAAHATEFDRAVARYTGPFLAAAEIQPRDRVLDIGCGTGHTTREAARLAAEGEAMGVDLSSAMLEVARREAMGDGARCRFVQGDAQVYPFPEASFDVAISRTGAMFFADPEAAFANIARALRPGGRLVLLVWQAAAANEWIREIVGAFAAGRPLPTPPPDAPGPFSLADPDRTARILAEAGYVDVAFRSLTEPECFGRDVDEAVSFIRGVAGWMLDGLEDEARARALQDLRASAEAHLTEDGVLFGSAAWLITARVPSRSV